MEELSVTEARDELADLVNRVQYAGERTFITRHGKRVAAVVPVSLVEEYEALETQADLNFAETEGVGGEESVPWERVKEELPRPSPAALFSELRRQFARALVALEPQDPSAVEIAPAEAVFAYRELSVVRREVDRFLSAVPVGTADYLPDVAPRYAVAADPEDDFEEATQAERTDS
ncbi:MAG: type II toxin-antitoxin system Phd/YefM family antitoxin [Actinomycetota bacterium]|nr:type II toxin-antitoxin system Phd/YefM family antitoxin [Actinomycetota bacterium]